MDLSIIGTESRAHFQSWSGVEVHYGAMVTFLIVQRKPLFRGEVERRNRLDSDFREELLETLAWDHLNSEGGHRC
jgi:hypothetical protein